jgi:protein involved in polysaccharide export with SLBB domain
MLFLDDPILHVGDRLRIVCPDVPEICVDRAVAADGTLDLPKVGTIPAAIRHLGEVSRQICARLPGGIYPATVEIRFLGPAAGTISVEGAVEKPLRLFAPHGILSDRLWEAAKLFPEADLALLGPTKRIAPGRILSVPVVTAERRISVLGGVLNPKGLPPSSGLTLGMAIEGAGGMGPHGDPNRIIIVRFGEMIPAQFPFDDGFRLMPGDLVRVGLIENRKYIIIRGLVEHPGSVEYAPGMTATRALNLAGGLSNRAKRGTLVWQTGAKTFRLSIDFLLSGRIPDPVINAEDTLTVEAR